MRSFASDNYAGVHPDVLQAILEANEGHERVYGEDSYTEKAIELFQMHFGKETDVYFVIKGFLALMLRFLPLTLLKPQLQGICSSFQLSQEHPLPVMTSRSCLGDRV